MGPGVKNSRPFLFESVSNLTMKTLAAFAAVLLLLPTSFDAQTPANHPAFDVVWIKPEAPDAPPARVVSVPLIYSSSITSSRRRQTARSLKP